jgi:membrane protein implicated in regulation of membrane protease activity
MILDIIRTLGGWSWWILGLVLLGVEVLLPGFFFLWFGIAAILIGISALLIDWPWQLQVVGFVVLSAIVALVGRHFYGTASGETSDPQLNVRGGRLEGRTLVLSEPIVEGRGRVKIDDTIWQVRGPDAPAGARIRIVGADGSVLTVTAA